MSKYDPLWAHVKESGKASLCLTFEEIERIAGVPIDHSFLTYKKELTAYGSRAGKRAMKQRTVQFERLEDVCANA